MNDDVKEMFARILQVPPSFLGVGSEVINQSVAEDYFVNITKEPWVKINDNQKC